MTSTPSQSSPVGRENENRLAAGAASAHSEQPSAPATESTAWSLRGAVVGSPVLVRQAHIGGGAIRRVKTVGKARVVLDDDSVWTLRGDAWGSGRGGYYRTTARTILDLEAVKAELHAERQERALDRLRRDIGNRFDAEHDKLSAAQIAEVTAILDRAKATQASQPEGEANPHSGVTP